MTFGRKKTYPARIPNPVKISFKNESRIKTETENLSLKNLYYRETLKEVF